MSDWRSVRLEEVAAVTVGHVGPMVDAYRTAGVPFLRSQNVRPHRIDLGDVKFIDDAFHGSLRKSALKPGDVVTVRTGAPGTTAVIPLALSVSNCADLVITRPGPDLHPQWLSYYLNWVIESHIAGHLVGAVQQHFNVKSAKRLELVLPGIAEQQAIVHVLGALDDKIAANRRMAERADDLTRARFEAISGQASTEVAVCDLALHPRDLVEPSAVSPGVAYVGLEHVPRRMMWLNDSGDARDVTSTKAAYRQGDVLFGKLRPYFHKVVAARSDGICSTDILVVRAKEVALSGFLLAAAASDATVGRCTAASEGTRMPRTRWKDLGAVRVPWPGEHAAKAFAAEVDILGQRVDAALTENMILAELRDTLLPELMSGRLRVKDAEKAVGKVV